jgi:hypothetical protein
VKEAQKRGILIELLSIERFFLWSSVVGETITEEFRWREAIPSTFYCSIRVFFFLLFWGECGRMLVPTAQSLRRINDG